VANGFLRRRGMSEEGGRWEGRKLDVCKETEKARA
jgi:hypothetical protein